MSLLPPLCAVAAAAVAAVVVAAAVLAVSVAQTLETVAVEHAVASGIVLVR
jgi:hypothetical protein